ncbi:hypothetical protein [Pseudomonas sp. NBRC 111131]|uniref:hypothetical protein n=1 Tax=Pseudomonas sp. NBRC 111131 TaxID=1661046 RepID=UPI00210C99D9|nr:hypothetical protein [Pseudomonas sp. NBRC 111131]
MLTKINKHQLMFLLWASMDAFYIALYCVRSIARGAVPFWSDVNSGLEVVRNWGGSDALIWVGLFLQVSILVTCIGFFKYQRLVVFLAAAQIPLRIFFVVPSISVVLLVPMVMAEINSWLWLGGLLASEVIKGWSIWWFCRTS